MKVKITRYLSSVKNYVKIFYTICILFSVSLIFIVLNRNETCNVGYPTKLSKLLNITKFVLLWRPKDCVDCAPFEKFRRGDAVFKTKKCTYQNCYVEINQENVLDEDQYDAIIFNGRPILQMSKGDLPQKRVPTQRYIFLQRESDYRFPVCQDYYDDFFNWTMTYRLDSDMPWPYFVIKNLKNEIVGPRVNMVWKQDTLPINNDLQKKLTNKTKLVAWFVSNCNDKSGRLQFAKELEKELRRFNETLDIYGRCGKLECPRNESKKCYEYIDKDYMFYLAFENSFTADYITEKLLTAVQHSAVPIVYGGADYNRFLSPGSYIDARSLGPKGATAAMIGAARNFTVYQTFFKWRNNYYYEDIYRNEDFACQLCMKLNEDYEPSQYREFRRWWNKEYERRCET